MSYKTLLLIKKIPKCSMSLPQEIEQMVSTGILNVIGTITLEKEWGLDLNVSSGDNTECA